MGAQKFKGKVVIAELGQGGGAALKYSDVLISNAELKALRAAPKTLVAAPGTVCEPETSLTSVPVGG